MSESFLENLGLIRNLFQMKRFIPLLVVLLFYLSSLYFIGFSPLSKIDNLVEHKTRIDTIISQIGMGNENYGTDKGDGKPIKAVSIISSNSSNLVFNIFFLSVCLLPILIYFPVPISWILKRIASSKKLSEEEIKKRDFLFNELIDLILVVLYLFLFIFLNGMVVILPFAKLFESFYWLIIVFAIFIIPLYIFDLTNRCRHYF